MARALIYLAELSPSFAEVLSGLIGNEVQPLLAGTPGHAAVEDGRIVTGDDLDMWERRLKERVGKYESIAEDSGPADNRGYNDYDDCVHLTRWHKKVCARPYLVHQANSVEFSGKSCISVRSLWLIRCAF
jgi:hypothetical protein